MLQCSSVYGGIIPLRQPFCELEEQIKPCYAHIEEQSKYFFFFKGRQKQVYTSVSSSLSLSFSAALFLISMLSSAPVT